MPAILLGDHAGHPYYPNLSEYVRDLYQQTGVAATVDLGYIKKHYFGSYETVNPTRVVFMDPEVDFSSPHDRNRFEKETSQ